MTITHAAVVAVADDGTSPVGSDEWNAAHTIAAGTIMRAQHANSPTVGLFYECDFMSAYSPGTAPWTYTATGTGTSAAVDGTANHPGIVALKCGTNSGDGYRYATNGLGWLLMAGGESTTMIFRPDVTAGTTAYLGFHDATTATAPTDGVYFSLVEDLLDGKAKNNAGPTSTATHYHVTAGVWYRGKITLNSDATLATFSLITCADGVEVWTDTVNANIPTGAGRVCGHGIIMTSTATAAVNTLSFDYMDIFINRTFVR